MTPVARPGTIPTISTVATMHTLLRRIVFTFFASVPARALDTRTYTYTHTHTHTHVRPIATDSCAYVTHTRTPIVCVYA